MKSSQCTAFLLFVRFLATHQSEMRHIGPYSFFEILSSGVRETFLSGEDVPRGVANEWDHLATTSQTLPLSNNANMSKWLSKNEAKLEGEKINP